MTKSKIILVGVAIELALLITLIDMTAQFVASKIYPIPEMPKIELPEQEKSIAQHICEATNGENCDILVNLAYCESKLDKEAYNVNTNGTIDLGLFQINSVHYGRTITASQALDVYASTRWSNEQIKQGNGHIWVCWDRI